MVQQWFEVQRHRGQVYVARQSGGRPQLQDHQAVVQIVAAGICGTDIRVMKGDKKIAANAHDYIISGHEGVGRIVAVGDGEEEFKPGDYVVVLPHVHKKDVICSALEINPTCISRGHTLHRGWDIDGCFADFIVVPTTSLKRIAPQALRLAEELAPDLGIAIFALVEPTLCVLSAYVLLEEQSEILLRRGLTAGRALVIGSGPIGVLHGLALLKRGYAVWFRDIQRKRAELARWCLKDQAHVFNEEHDPQDFDIVMVAASSAEAVRKAEAAVKDGGIVYLFAGLNAIDQIAMDAAGVFSYEGLHRSTKGMVTITSFGHKDKTIFYLGHSGYFEHLAGEAISVIAEQAGELSRVITGIIPGWSSSHIESRLPGGADWETEDKSPAIISVLHDANVHHRHCKILVCPRLL